MNHIDQVTTLDLVSAASHRLRQSYCCAFSYIVTCLLASADLFLDLYGKEDFIYVEGVLNGVLFTEIVIAFCAFGCKFWYRWSNILDLIILISSISLFVVVLLAVPEGHRTQDWDNDHVEGFVASLDNILILIRYIVQIIRLCVLCGRYKEQRKAMDVPNVVFDEPLLIAEDDSSHVQYSVPSESLI